ncbi:DUF6734 family protein [Flavobacterium aestuarii]|uniref:DUF6734 family protein n=1 Tax=Flavobacterium aestuarii TaxID=3149227 RepID=UPI0032B5BCCC
MKIIQSFWTKPSTFISDDQNARYNGGWLQQKYAFYSYALSALTISKHYDNLELYTDDFGLELFKNVLQLPYTKIHLNLNSLDNYNPKLWAIGKLVACSVQEEPFMHLDNDIFLWKKINYNEEQYDLISQNLEVDYPNYSQAFNHILENFEWIPDELIETNQKHNKILAYNAGVIGGRNLNFFKDLKIKAFKFIDSNENCMENLDLGIFNTIFEQQLGYALAEKKKLDIQFLFNNVSPNFEQVLDFFSVPAYSKYIHCVGYAKKSIFATEQVEARLAYHFPEYYKALNLRLNTFFNSQEYTKSSISIERMAFLSNHYKLLDNLSIEEIFSLKFRINDKCKIEIDEKGNAHIEFIVPQLCKIEKEILSGWSTILLYFKDPVTIKDLYEELITDTDFMNNFEDFEVFKMKLISFILEKTLVLEILKPQLN